MSEQLRERLFQKIDARPGSSVMALLDPNHPVAAHDDLHLERVEKRESRPTLTVVQRPDYAHDLGICPRLLLLRSPGDCGYQDGALLDLTWECAQRRKASINGAYVCAWLVSDLSTEKIAAQLDRNMVVRGGRQQPRKVLPLFEPHRMALAAHLAPSSWLSNWLGGISSWMFVDACGQLQEVQSSVRDVAQVPVAPGADFWVAQSRVRRAREVLLALIKAGHMVPTGVEAKLDLALQLAYANGLSQLEDVIFFAVNQMTLSPHWSEHREAKACIELARSGEMALTDAMEGLPDGVLDDLVGQDGAMAQMQEHSKEAKWPLRIQ